MSGRDETPFELDRRSVLGGIAGVGGLSLLGSNALASSASVDAEALFPSGFEPRTPVDSHHPGEPRFVAVGEPLINPIWAVGFAAAETPGYDGDDVPSDVLYGKGRDNLAPRLTALRDAPSDFDPSDFEWSLVDYPAESAGPDEVLSFASDSTAVPRYDGHDAENVAEFRADAPGTYTLELEAPDGTHELTIHAFERGDGGGAAVYRGDPNGAPRIELEAEYDADAGAFTIRSNAQSAPDVDGGADDLRTKFLADDRDALETSDVRVADDGLSATVDEAALDGESARIHAAAYDERVGKKSAQDVVELEPGGGVDLPNRPPEWIKDGVMYQLFPRSWAGEREATTLETLIAGGDAARGVDYLEELGVDVLWLTPIVPATSVQRQFAYRDDFDLDAGTPIDESERQLSGGGPHGYDAADYTAISQDLVPDGEDGIDLYKEFIAQCNEAGIKVLFDLVINHVGVTNPLFRDTVAEESDGPDEWPTVEAWDEDSPYFDWFDRADLERRTEDGELLEAAPRAAGFADLRVMPNLNYDNLALREYVLGVADFWSREVGVDGFRADIAYGVPRDFWTELRELVRANDGEFLMFDETVPRDAALSENTFSLHHDTAGFTTTAHDVVADEAHGGSLFDTIPQRARDGLPDHSLFINALENHDEHRILNQAAVDLHDPNHDELADSEWEFYAERLRKCWAAAITMPGVPHLYYGQERQISRYGEGRHLGSDDDRGFDEDGSINVSADVRPGGRQRAFVNWTEYDESHLEWYTDLISFYKDYEVLHPDAGFEPIEYDVEGDLADAELLLFGRDGTDLEITGPDKVAVVINFGEEPETVRLTPETDTTDLFRGADVAAPADADDDSATIVAVEDLVVLETEAFGRTDELLATWDDPAGDDRGPGWYEYPDAADFNDGAFDLTGFEVHESDERVRFVLELADLQNNFDGDRGFSLQYPHIFVRDPDAEETREWAHSETPVRFDSAVSHLIRADGHAGVEVLDATETPLEVETAAEGDEAANEISIEVPRELFDGGLADLELVPLLLGEDTGGVRPVTEDGGDYAFEDAKFDDADFENGDPWSRHGVIDAVTPDGVDNADALAYEADPASEAVVPLLEMESGVRNRRYPGDLVREHDGGDGGSGPGSYIYPTNLEIPDGSIDIRRVAVYEDRDDERGAIAFEMDPDSLANQWDFDRGFSHPAPQVYIRNPDADGGTETAREGVRATLDGDYQYRLAADGDAVAAFEDADGNGVGPLEVDLVEDDDAIVLRFSTAPLEAPLETHDLAFVVGAHDGYAPGGLRDVVTADEPQEWAFAGAETENAPRLLDVVTPEGVSQADALSATDDELATIPYVAPDLTLEDYVIDGEVPPEKLRQAERDWEADRIDTETLRDVAAIWRRGGAE